MKIKKLAFVIAVIFVVSAVFAGCINTGPTKEINVDTASIVEETVKTTFAVGETAVFDDMKITATELKESSGEGFFKPENGNVFIGINFTIENTSSEDISISSLMLFDAYIDNIKCEYSFNALCAFDEGTLDGDVSPGKKLVGWYAVEVPADWTELELQFKNEWLDDSNESATFIFAK